MFVTSLCAARIIFAVFFSLVLLGGCQTARAIDSSARPTQAELDALFLEEFGELIGQRVLGDYARYNHCCILLGTDLVAVNAALEDFKSRGYGDLYKFGVAIGRSGDKVVVNLEPRYFKTETKPYYDLANVNGYIYIVDLSSAQILSFYAKP